MRGIALFGAGSSAAPRLGTSEACQCLSSMHNVLGQHAQFYVLNPWEQQSKHENGKLLGIAHRRAGYTLSAKN